MKRWLLRLAAAIVTVTLIAISIELMATAYLLVTTGEYVSARERFAGQPNTFVEGLSHDECGYLDTLYPHPYLGFVHHGNPPCGIADVNNIGLFGPDYPSARPGDRFVVLVTGGSVAAQFASGVDGGPSYLERFLNDRYVSPTGKPFQILNGGDGAWKQPQSAILFLLYADAVHAVVTLDGFNEHYMLESGYRFEYPANNFHTVNPLANREFGDVVARWMVSRIRRWAAGNSLLSRSQAAYTLIAGADNYLARRATAQPQPQTTVESIFAMPAEWTPPDRKQWALRQYQKYLRVMTHMAADYGVLEAHFIQPAPAVGKVLTPDEQRVVGPLAYRDLYREMANALLTLNERGTPVISLLDIFEDEPRTLYGDAVHLERDAQGNSVGYALMSDRMATDLGRLWGLTGR